MKAAILLRKWRGKLVANIRGGGWLIATDRGSGMPLDTFAIGLCLMLIPVLLALAAVAAIVTTSDLTMAALPLPLAFGITGKTRSDLDKIIADAEAIEAKYKGKEMPQDEGTKLAALYTEGETLSKEINEQAAAQKERERQKAGMKSAQSYLREVPDPAVPDANRRETDTKAMKHAHAGYVRLGDLLTMSPEFKEYAAKQFPKSSLALAISIPGLLPIPSIGFKGGFVPVNREMRQKIEEMEAKDLPVFGSRVIEPDRLPDIAADTENDRLVMRDILNVVPTNSNVIEWVGKKDFTRNADVQSEGPTVALTAEKDEVDAEYEMRSTNVLTIAGHIPVSTQQLADAPALISDIQTDLIYDVRKKEEEKVVWDDASTALEFDGLDANITDDNGNDLVGDSLIDKLRRRLTFVTLRRYESNAIAIHPTDWEAIELEKGSDQHYIWAIIRDTLGARIWSVRVVETVAMQDPAGTTRIAIVGDWRRGATLFDRMQATLSIGMIDKDFIKNIRRILAEERVGFAVRRPGAFSKIVTESP